MAEAVRERPPTALTPPVARLVASPPAGEPLRPPVRTNLERSLGVNLASVRVHTDARTAKVVDQMPARAFTYGTHVYLGSKEQPTDVRLMAHEAAHVVQQQAMPQVQPAGEHVGASALEGEAQRAGEAAGQGERFSVRGRTAGPEVQGGILEWLEDKAWDILNEVAPDLVPIVRQGIFAWLEEKITAAIQTVVDVLLAPVRAVSGAIDAVGEVFAELIGWVRDAAARIAKGDCGAITEAATKIEHVLTAFAAPMIERITGIAKKVGDFFTGLWDRFGAPVWDFLKKVGGAVWEKIEQLASWIWKKTEPIRDLAARAWKWFKDKLGIGEGPEGQNGLLQWVQSKASAVWDAVKAKIEPIKKPLLIVAGVLVMLSPAGPIIAIGGAAVGLYKAITWIKANLSTPDGVVRQREQLRTVIIPAITGAVNGVTAKLGALASSMSEKLGTVVGGLGNLVGALAGSFLRFAVGAVEWIANQAGRLLAWASTQVTRLVDLVARALTGLSAFMQPVLGVLGKVVAVVGDVMQLPILFAGRVWHAIPACIRNPFVAFLVNHILRHVPIFGELLADPQVWGKLREGATRLVRQIFRDFDLKGAIRSVFELILTVFKIPLEMVQQIYRKAAGAWDQIYRQPLNFLRNLLKAMKQGFSQFFSGIVVHLGKGLAQWLMGQLGPVNIRWPGDLSFRSVLGLVLDLLGLTVDKIFERLGKKIGPDKAEKLRKAVTMLTGALEWIADLIREGPAGLWKKLVDRLGNLWDVVSGAIVGWIRGKVVAFVSKKILSMLDPTGFMAVVNSLIAVYDTIKWAVEYAKQILEFVSTILDAVVGIVAGAIAPAANFLEQALARAIPIAIGFLAQHANLGKLGTRIREMVEEVRKRIDAGIDWLIDLVMKGAQAVLNALGLGKKEPEKAGAPAGVRGQAVSLLASRLADAHTREEARDIVRKVETELKPAGLKSLALGEETAEVEEFAIQAEASPKLPLARLRSKVKKPKGRSVTSVIEITVQSPITVTPARFAPTDPEATVSFGGGVMKQQPSTTRPKGQAPPQRSLQVVTWNTSNIYTSGNNSHAEHQFVAWLLARPTIMEDIETIVVSNFTASPCSECGPELTSLLKTIRTTQTAGGQPLKLKDGGARVYWSTLHSSVQPTSWQTLRIMQEAGWRIHAPSEALPPEGGLPDDVWVYFPW